MSVNPADSVVFGTLYGSEAMREAAGDRAWLQRMRITDAGGRLLPAHDQHPALAQMRQWKLRA